jgi:hypothetical protein
MVLLGLCLVGVVGIILSSMALLNADPESTSQLVHGSEVGVWRLQPMRDAGVLELTEVPLAWHDESPMRDGTEICALRAGNLVQVSQGKATQLSFGRITPPTMTENQDGGIHVVATDGSASVTCRFGPKEGGSSFFKQLDQARKNAQAQSP